MRPAKMNLLLALAAGILLSFSTPGAEPVLRVVQAGGAGRSLLRNGDFGTLNQGRPAAWTLAPQGCAIAPGQGRNGSAALVCESPGGQGWFGANQTVALNQTNAAPLVVRGWSKALEVNGSADSSYSLYADLIYEDGTPLWGQTANFRAGTHDWERRELVIVPEKPVRSLTLNCLFRGRAGKVWFDDVQVEEVKAEGGAMLFQGVAVTAVKPAKVQNSPRRWLFGEASAARAASPVLDLSAARNWATYLLVRDVAANSDFFPFENGACPDLGLKLATAPAVGGEGLKLAGRVVDTTGKDRAITLVFAWPCPAETWHWGDDLRRERVMRGNGDYFNQVAVRCGATGTMSLYPLGAVWNESHGLALGVDMGQAAQYRLGCHAGLRVLYLAYDFGLVRETERCPSGADFRFVLFSFDPRWGFRSAWQRYMELFPAHFAVRSKEQGTWMPFTDVSTVQGWEDFGFRYHEGNNNVPWDDDHGVLSFRYTEPMTWWMPMKKETARTPAEAARVRDELAQGKNDSSRRMASVTHLAAMFDEAGQPCLQFQDTPWCNGAVWSLNPNPWLATGPAAPSNLNAATVHWNERIREQLYGPAAKGRLDGEYLDSLEGYVTADLNLRRDHFRFTSVPLTFSQETKQPALSKGLAVYRVHAVDQRGRPSLGQVDVRQRRALPVQLSLPLAGRAGHGDRLVVRGPIPPCLPVANGPVADHVRRQALPAADEHRLRPVHARVGGEVLQPLPLLRHVARLLQPQCGGQSLLEESKMVQPGPAPLQKVPAAGPSRGRSRLAAGSRRSLQQPESPGGAVRAHPARRDLLDGLQRHRRAPTGPSHSRP